MFKFYTIPIIPPGTYFGMGEGGGGWGLYMHGRRFPFQKFVPKHPGAYFRGLGGGGPIFGMLWYSLLLFDFLVGIRKEFLRGKAKFPEERQKPQREAKFPEGGQNTQREAAEISRGWAKSRVNSPWG